LGHAPKFVTIGNLGNDLLFVTIGSLGHALDFVTIGKLGNDLLFVNIGNLGNVLVVAKIANGFKRGNKRGGRWGRKAPFIGNIGKIVMPFKLAKPHINRPLQYKINDKTANSPVIVL
jgi:hypothetical protein